MKKGMYLAYGLICYMVFFPTFLYLIGFVSGVGVPKNIDSGFGYHWSQALWINGLLIGLFAVQHTIMARPAFKNIWTRIVPKPVERSTFVLITSIIFILMFRYWRPVNDMVWSVSDPVATALISAVCLSGWVIALLSTFMIDHFDLFGVSQVIRNFKGTKEQNPKFMVRGFYKKMRHPLMFGFLVAFWATPTMTLGRMFFSTLFTLYILAALVIEERDLVKLHGPDYVRYQQDVPMLIPTLKKAKKIQMAASI